MANTYLRDMNWRLGSAFLIIVLSVGVSAVAPVGGAPTDHLPTGIDASGNTSQPHAEAGLDQTVPVDGVVYLDAYGSRGIESELDAYEWTIERPDGTTTVPNCPTCELTQFRPKQSGQYTVTLTVEDEQGRTATDTLYVTVVSRPVPEATLSGPDELRVNEPATFDLDATAPTGTLASVEWYVDGTYRNGTFLDAKRADESITISPESAGNHTVTAVVRDDNGTATRVRQILTARETVPFEVTITGADRNTQPGEPWAPSVEVENTGSEAATQEVTLRLPGATDSDSVATETVTLDPGERQVFDDNFITYGGIAVDVGNPSLIWRPSSSDVGTFTAIAESGTHSDSVNVDVLTPPNYDVEITSTVEDYYQYSYEVEITNTGGSAGSQDLRWTTNRLGDRYAESGISLDPGESTTFSDSLSVPSFIDYRDDDTFTVKSADDSDSVSINGGPNSVGDSNDNSNDDSDFDGFNWDSLTVSGSNVKVGDYTQLTVTSVTTADGSTTYSGSEYISKTGDAGFAAEDQWTSWPGGVDFRGDYKLPRADADKDATVRYKGAGAGEVRLCASPWAGTGDQYIDPAAEKVNGCTTITVEEDEEENDSEGSNPNP